MLCLAVRISKYRQRSKKYTDLHFEITFNSVSYLFRHNSVDLANEGFYELNRQFRSQFLSIKNKIKLYMTLIRPVLACGSETWVLSKCDEAVLGVFERKILRAIFGPTNDNGE